MKVIVIGGGPAGMMAAISSAQDGNEVILLEKMQSLGRKLLITGKGRCNVTSSLDMDEFIKNTPGNGMFLYSCYKQFTNQDIINFLKEEGLEVKEERGNRIFPVTDKSLDVLKCFSKKIKELGIKVKCNTQVEEILVENSQIIGVIAEGTKIKADKIILATGGKSYPLTGSTGDGYELVKKLGHTITKIQPSLVPLESYNRDMCKELQGLSLRNIKIQLEDIEAKKNIYEDFGEMMFTHFGVSGPTILSSSAHLVRYKKIEEKFIINYEDLLKDFLSNIKDNNKYDFTLKLRNKFTPDEIYKIETLLPEERDKYLKELLTDEEYKVYEIFVISNKFNMVDFIDYLNRLIELNNPTVTVLVPNKNINYDYIDSKIKTKVSDNIYRGIKIIYKNKVYDFSLNEGNV